MTTSLATKTSQQILDQQKRDAERTQSKAVAAPNSRNALDSYLDEVAPSAFSGRLVKFNKDVRDFRHRRCDR